MQTKEKLRMKIDRQDGRADTSWSFGEALGIRVWHLVWLFLMSWTPKCLNRWRVFLFRCFGAKIHGRPFVFPSARVHVPWNVEFYRSACLGPNCTVYSLGRVILRERCVISQEAYLCGGSHDFDSRRNPLLVGDIDIGQDVFIGARAFVLPGVTIGDEAVVGAMSVVAKDVAPRQIVAGNPARVIGQRQLHED